MKAPAVRFQPSERLAAVPVVGVRSAAGGSLLARLGAV